MKIYLATDHTGFEIKNFIKERLQIDGYEVEDCGSYDYNPDDDYTDFVKIAAQKVSLNPKDRGFIFGGSGQAENMLANKYKNVRSALFYSAIPPIGEADITGRKSDSPYEMVKLTRLHNDANMLSFGIRFLERETIYEAVKAFLNTEFSEDERHVRRIGKIKTIEAEI